MEQTVGAKPTSLSWDFLVYEPTSTRTVFTCVYLKEWSFWGFQIEKQRLFYKIHRDGAGTYGMPISKTLFWISCFPNMMILSWIQSSIRQPPGAHWEENVQDVLTRWVGLQDLVVGGRGANFSDIYCDLKCDYIVFINILF